jgi:thioredoxin-related protein
MPLLWFMVNNMTKIKKIFLTIIMILTLTSLLTACGDSGRDDIKFDEDGKIIVDGDAVEVKFWGWGDKEEVEVFTRIVNSFNKKYEGAIKVNYIQRPSGSYADNLLVQLSGKSGPDVFYAQDKVIKQYAALSGVSAEEAEKCLHNDENAREILSNRQNGVAQLGIRGTPTFIISSEGKYEQVVNDYSLSAFRNLITSKLSKKISSN